MILLIRRTALIYFLLMLSSSILQAQNRISDEPNDLLLLKLCGDYIYVAQQARIEIDSTLEISSRRHHISDIPIIVEGFDDKFPLGNNIWMENGNVLKESSRLRSLKGKEHARAALYLSAYYAFKPGQDNQNMTKCLAYLRLAKQESDQLGLSDWVAQSDILLGKTYIKQGKFAAAESAFKSAIDLAVKTKNTALQAKAYKYEGIYLPFLPSLLPFRINCLEKALALYKTIQDKPSQIHTLMLIAYQSYAINNFKRSKSAALESLDLQQSIGFRYIHYTNDMLSLLSFAQLNYAAGAGFALSAVKSAEETRDSIPLAYIYTHVALAFFYTGLEVESNNWLKKAFDQFIKDGGDRTMYQILQSKAFLQYELGKDKSSLRALNGLIKNFPPSNTIDEESAYIALATCYEKLNNLNEAEKYMLMAEKLEGPNRLIRGNLLEGYVYYRLGGLYASMKNHKKNRYYSYKYLSISHDTSLRQETYWNLFLADSALGDFSKLRNLYLYTTLKNKALTAAKNKEVDELNVRYQTLEKQKALELSQAKNLLQLHEEVTTRRYTLASLGILVMIIVFILMRYMGKQKSNRQLQAQRDEIAQKNAQLEEVIDEKNGLLATKEWLLKEVHHRVKNNLQMVMSLLNSQTAYLKDVTALNAVMESRYRVNAMSLIHKKLYKSDNASFINMEDYIKDLVLSLKESFNTKLTIYFEMQIEAINLDVSQAIPLGLILNELITNSIKYAFPHTTEDRISITFYKMITDEIALIFADNGRGLPNDFNTKGKDSFGMELINGLTDELGGEISITSENGTTINIIFKEFDFYHGKIKNGLSDNSLQHSV